MGRRRGACSMVVLLAGALFIAACGSSTAPDARLDAAPPPGSDQGPCPPDLVIQTDWFPEIEHGGVYQLIGPGGTVDTERLTYAGPMRNGYKGAHGVQRVEIRAGGAAVDNQSVTGLMYADEEVTLGFVNTDDAIAARLADQAVIGVAGTLDLSPQMLMWSPARHTITDFEDLAASRAPVLYFGGMAYVDYLVSQGYLTAGQLDSSYKGDPSRWLDSNGAIIQQGFVTNEVYTYENLLDGWKRPVDFFLIHWMGYENYPAMLSVRADRLEEHRACLAALVPILQQAWVDFLGQPGPVSDALVSIVDDYDTFFRISEGLNERAIEMFDQFELASNGSDDTYGNFDTERVQRLVTILQQVYADRGTPLDPSLQAADVVTNEFIDPSIGLDTAPS
jgi:hypothetical protein